MTYSSDFVKYWMKKKWRAPYSRRRFKWLNNRFMFEGQIRKDMSTYSIKLPETVSLFRQQISYLVPIWHEYCSFSSRGLLNVTFTIQQIFLNPFRTGELSCLTTEVGLQGK